MKAIVLSGGGGKGAYQIGVWKALRKLKYDYKIVTGTSIGAINGLMMIQKEFYKSYNLWRNVNPKKMIGIDFKGNQYFDYIKKIFKEGGIPTSNVEKFVNKLYNKRKFFKSGIDYGIVTYNFSKLKPHVMQKRELLEKDIVKYIVASATCFPAFKMTDINNEKYIDGGFYDYFPINLAIDMGATEIIAIDLDAIGIRRKIKNKEIKITYIKPNNEISGFLEFDKKKTRKDIKYGYNDTMKKFGIFYGKKYTFYGNELDEGKYQRILEFTDQIFDSSIRIVSFKISKLFKDINDKEKLQCVFDEKLEYLLEKFDYEDSKVYDAKKISKKIYKKIKYNQRKNKKSKMSIEENNRIAFLYKLIEEKRYKEIRKNINSGCNEFICAMYLYFIKR